MRRVSVTSHNEHHYGEHASNAVHKARKGAGIEEFIRAAGGGYGGGNRDRVAAHPIRLAQAKRATPRLQQARSCTVHLSRVV